VYPDIVVHLRGTDEDNLQLSKRSQRGTQKLACPSATESSSKSLPSPMRNIDISSASLSALTASQNLDLCGLRMGLNCTIQIPPRATKHDCSTCRLKLTISIGKSAEELRNYRSAAPTSSSTP
jgi:hypothetical protein